MVLCWLFSAPSDASLNVGLTAAARLQFAPPPAAVIIVQADRRATSSIIVLFMKSSTSKVNLQPYQASKCPSSSRLQIKFYLPAIWPLDCGRDQVAFQNNFMVAGRRDSTALELIRSVYHRRYRHLMSHQQLYWRGSSPRTRCSRSQLRSAVKLRVLRTSAAALLFRLTCLTVAGEAKVEQTASVQMLPLLHNILFAGTGSGPSGGLVRRVAGSFLSQPRLTPGIISLLDTDTQTG